MIEENTPPDDQQNPNDVPPQTDFSGEENAEFPISSNSVTGEQSPPPIKKLPKPLMLGSVVLLVLIFAYGMTVPTTESGVNSVTTIFASIGFSVAIAQAVFVGINSYSSVSRRNKSLREIIKANDYLLGILTVALLLVFSYFPPLLILLLVWFWFLRKFSKSKKIVERVHPVVKFFTVAVSIIIGFSSVAFLVAVGVFGLGLRACELSSSKCL